jgi:hypothetical protein
MFQPANLEGRSLFPMLRHLLAENDNNLVTKLKERVHTCE